MNYITEQIYTVIEALLITGFIAMYFETSGRFSKKVSIIISFLSILTLDTIISIMDTSWILTMLIFIPVLILIMELFYQGSLLEHLLLAIITVLLVALIDICVFALISKIIGIKYSDFVTQNGTLRLLTVLITKIIYLMIISAIITFKKKYTLLFHSTELIMMSFTFIVSGILICIVRNMIYSMKDYYNVFLIVLVCVLLINIGQYYTMIYISKKNIDEKNLSLIRKQMEMQKDCICNLEQKYYETAKIRHDMQNYISCALHLAEQGNDSELVHYLRELSDDKLNMITSYVQTKRKVLGVVINAKLGIAKKNGVDMRCMILNEMEHVADTDAGILLANLLDNAIEACEKNKNASEIILKIWSEAGYYCIEISNTVEQDILADNPFLKTNKSDQSLHGIGLKSVKDIVEKYKGMINFDQKSNKFYVYVALSRCAF